MWVDPHHVESMFTVGMLFPTTVDLEGIWRHLQALTGPVFELGRSGRDE